MAGAVPLGFGEPYIVVQVKSEIVVRFDTGPPARMPPACDRFYSAVVTGSLTHEGDPHLARHVANAHARDTGSGGSSSRTTRTQRPRWTAPWAGVIAHERANFHAADPPVEFVPMVAWR